MKNRKWIITAVMACLVSTVAFSQGFMGNFNDTSYIDLGYNLTDTPVRSITFEFTPSSTINGTSNDGYTFIGRNDPSEWKEFGIFIRGTDWANVGGMGKLCFYYRQNHVLHEIYSNQNVWYANTCYHVAGTLDSLQGMKLYVDGVLQNSQDQFGYGPVMADTSYMTAIGCWGDYFQRHFKGTINNMAIWGTALTSAQVQATIVGSITPSNPDLVALYKFDEGTGGQLNDATTNNNNGVVHGSTWVKEYRCFSATEIISNSMDTKNSVYPNPFTDKLNCRDFTDNVKIYDSTGRLVIEENPKDQPEIGVAQLPPGIYFLRSGPVTVKLVKNTTY